MDFMNVLIMVWNFVLTAAGITAALVILVNIGKTKISWLKFTPIVKDGDADRWFKGLQFLAFAGLAVLKITLPDFDLGIVNQFALDLAKTYGALIALLVPFASVFGKFLHDIGLKRLPIVGASHSDTAK